MLKKEVSIFLIVGIATVLIDFIVYLGLTSFGLLSFDIAKGVSFLVGTVFAYCANYAWTFNAQGHKYRSILPFVVLYSLTLYVNVMTNAGLLHQLNGESFALPVAFLIATVVSASLNFLGMKFFVFRSYDKEGVT